MKSHINHHLLEFEYFPHEKIDIKKINWSNYPGAWMARWTTDFDCDHETQFWYVIKDTPFNIDELKAKRRYEINKGNKNFYTKVINPIEYKEQLYHVYCESLKGYEGTPVPIEEHDFYEKAQKWANIKEQVMFGCFRIDDDCLCGYADVYRRNPYLPISSLRQHRTIRGIRTMPPEQKRKASAALAFFLRRRTESDCQAGPVSQNQICQRKHDVEFCFLFLKSSVSCFLEFKQALYNPENMFDLRPYRRLRMLPLLSLVLTAFAELAHLAGATVDLIPNLLAGFVSYFGIFSLLCAKVSAVSVERLFLSVHEFGGHSHIGYIGRRGLDCVNNTTVSVHANMCLVSKIPGVAFFRLMGVWIPLLFRVLRGRRC